MYALVITALLLVFSLVSWQVVVGGPVLRADAALRDAAGRWSTPHGNRAAVAGFWADLGGAPVAGGALAVCAGVLAWRRRSFALVAAAVLAAALVPALALPLKEAFGRPGPDGLPLRGYAGYYPSGHALTATVAYGMSAVLYARRAPSAWLWWVRARYAYAFAAVLILCAGAGLVLRGHHWATDVVASWALGGLVLCALAPLAARSPGCRLIGRGAPRTAPQERPPRAAPGPDPADR